jgi:transcriptional regulator with XRE-family HTH domain
VKREPKTPFAERLIEAFGEDVSNTEIAKRLNVSGSLLTKWMQGAYPEYEELVEIAKATNCSLHWLIMDRGPKEREVVEAIKDGQVDIAQIRREALIKHHLLQAQLLSREAELLQAEQNLDSSQAKQKQA